MNRVNIIREMLLWVENNLEHPLSLDTVTARVGYSKWHLQRLFRKHTGQRLGSYLRGRRISAAAEEMRLTDHPIIYIARKYQFSDQQTFSRTFKNHFGLPPGEYRNANSCSKKGLCPPLKLM
ncbi:helix-turn-helix domain-containing protein [Buttiauxella gaviniae]|uniref:helix-turn-helix domain-containing protein n=1 Tax=Buttiauxella gaviniae TaxID=82990 RepID=UPI003BB66E3C